MIVFEELAIKLQIGSASVRRRVEENLIATIVLQFRSRVSGFILLLQTSEYLSAPDSHACPNKVEFEPLRFPIAVMSSLVQKMCVIDSIDYGTGTSNSQVRLELYYVNSDSEKSIRGVDSTVVLGTGATTEPSNVIGGYYVNQTGTIAANNATVEIQDYQKSPVLTWLVRRTNGTASITCTYMGGPCTTAGSTMSKVYTYVGETLVSSD